jgi:hypothetical protein
VVINELFDNLPLYIIEYLTKKNIDIDNMWFYKKKFKKKPTQRLLKKQ